MSKLERLIEELCPDGMEFYKISDIADTYIGLVTCMTKNYRENGVLMINNSNIKEGYFEFKKKIYLDSYFADKNEHKKNKIGDILTVHTGDVGTSAIINESLDGCIGFATITTRIKDKRINNKFVCALLNSKICKNQIKKMTKGDRNNLNLKDYNKILIPVPPLSIQEEIVRILDSFTELKAQLEEELEARKKQYEWYKEKLLEFGNNVEYKYLYECLLKVSNIKWIQTDTEYKYIDLTSVDINRHQIKEIKKINKENAPSRAKQIVHCEDVIFATTRPTLKRYYFVGHEYNNQICSTGFCVLRANDKFVLPKWIYYLISSKKFSYYVEQNQEGASYPSISDSKVKNFKIPLPPLEEQQRIVDILNRFDKLCNDISEGLPAEIDARQKQYEYYRDKLLTFKRLGK